jgi:hypothetical protein
MLQQHCPDLQMLVTVVLLRCGRMPKSGRGLRAKKCVMLCESTTRLQFHNLDAPRSNEATITLKTQFFLLEVKIPLQHVDCCQDCLHSLPQGTTLRQQHFCTILKCHSSWRVTQTSAAVPTSNSIHSFKVCMLLAVTSWWFENIHGLIPMTTVVQGNGYAGDNSVQLGSYFMTCHNTYSKICNVQYWSIRKSLLTGKLTKSPIIFHSCINLQHQLLFRKFDRLTHCSRHSEWWSDIVVW